MHSATHKSLIRGSHYVQFKPGTKRVMHLCLRGGRLHELFGILNKFYTPSLIYLLSHLLITMRMRTVTCARFSITCIGFGIKLLEKSLTTRIRTGYIVNSWPLLPFGALLMS